MLEGLKTYLLYGKDFASLEIVSKEEQLHFYGVSATKKKGEFANLTSFDANSVSEIAKTLSKNAHCYLTINSDKVLIEQTALRDQDSLILSEAFPSLTTDEFYYEILRTTEKAFVAICRKTEIDNLLSELSKTGVNILGFHMGFGSLKNIIEYIPSERIETSRYTIDSENNDVIAFEENEMVPSKSYSIEGEQIDSNHLLALAGLFDYLGVSKLSSNLHAKSSGLAQNFSKKVLLKKGLLAGGFLLFVSLIVNALLFNNYYSELQSLQEQSALVESHKKDYAQKQKAIEQKENIVNNILLSGNSKSGFYLNRLVISLPETILFSLLEYQPLEKSIRPDKPITYLSDEVSIEGESADKAAFNKWIEDLDQLEWIEEVSTYKYSEVNGKVASFGITLKITDDTEK